MKRIMVTGASGFIGRKLCQALKSDGLSVVGLDARSGAPGPWDQIHEADITSPLKASLFGDIDTVYHLAGKVHALAEVEQDETDYYRINTEGTQHVLEAARKASVRRFVFFSTVKAMGPEEPVKRCGITEVGRKRCACYASTPGELGGDRPRAEDDSSEPDTPYGRSKLAAEQLVLQGDYVSEPVVLRLCMVYGAGAKGNIQKMLDAVRQHRFPPLPEVKNRRSMVHVQDVIRAAILAGRSMEAVGQVFIVSDGRAYSTRQIYEWMCQTLHRSPPNWGVPLWGLKGLGLVGDLIGKMRGRRFVFDTDALEKLIGSAWFSSQKIESKLNFRPQWNLERALPEMLGELGR